MNRVAADPLLFGRTCKYMRFTVEPLAQNVADARQRERRLNACVRSKDLAILGRVSVKVEEDMRAILAAQPVADAGIPGR